MNKKFVRNKIPILYIILMVITSVSAQKFIGTSDINSNTKSYHYFVEPGVPTVRVNVLGAVNYPGIYEISEGTNLKDFLALTGGPKIDSRRYERIQKVYIRLYRSMSDTGNQLIYESQLNESLNSQKKLPIILDGDVLTLEVVEKRGFEWRDLLTIVNVANTVLLIIIAIGQIKN